MKIEIQKATIKGPKNVYVIKMDTYFGDADGDATFKIEVKPEKIQQVIAEALIIQEQFPNGRGGCSRRYDQTNYFNMPHELYKANGEAHDGYFEWFDQEGPEYYPYSGDYEQNYSLRDFEVFWYDADGQKFKVKYSEYGDLLKELAELNAKHQLADYKAWDDPSYPYHASKTEMAVYETAVAKMEEQFAAYRADAVELVKRHIDSSVD